MGVHGESVIFQNLNYTAIDKTIIIPIGHTVLLGLFKSLLSYIFRDSAYSKSLKKRIVELQSKKSLVKGKLNNKKTVTALK